jgi:hypothetical protein
MNASKKPDFRRGNVLERDGKLWTVPDIDKLERERDDYKDRWETLGRVAKRIIDRQAKEIQTMRAVIEQLDPPKV